MPVIGCAWHAVHPPSVMTRADPVRSKRRLRSTAVRDVGAVLGVFVPVADGLTLVEVSFSIDNTAESLYLRAQSATVSPVVDAAVVLAPRSRSNRIREIGR